MKLVNMHDSKSCALRPEGSSPSFGTNVSYKRSLSYIIGIAIGDGNLSNPNGRAVRLRVSCDEKYPLIIQEIIHEIHVVLPKNKVSLIKRKSHCIDVSCYSNQWEGLLGWLAKGGPKYQQNICVPQWIKNNSKYAKQCLKGLIETDGSIYYDRGYLMVNFTNIIPQIIRDFIDMLDTLGYNSHVYLRKDGNKSKQVVRVSSDTQKLVRLLTIRSKNPVKE